MMWKVAIFIITLCIGLQWTSAQDGSETTDITVPVQVIESTGY